MTVRYGLVAFDAPDIEALSAFYAQLTGWQPEKQTEDDWMELRTGAGQKVAFQLAPDHVPPQWPGQEHPQQLHLDLMVDDQDALAGRAVALGAKRLATGPTWITLADPAGHPFDLCRRDPGAAAAEPVELYSVCYDVPDSGAAARFYSDVLGWPVAYDGPEGAMVESDGRRLMFQNVEGYQPPRWPDPAHPQQGHLDLDVDVADFAAGEAQVLALGATAKDAGDGDFRVYADPFGHPFCLISR